MAGVELIVIVTVGKVVDVCVERNVLGERTFGHGVEHPVAGGFLHQPSDGIQRNGGTCSARADEVAARTEGGVIRQLESIPEGECMPRNIGELCADGSRVGIGRDDHGIEIGVTSLSLPPADDMAIHSGLKSAHALVAGENVE